MSGHIGVAPATAGGPVKRASNDAILGWMLVDWALQPFHTLIVTFLFAPYFTNAVAGDPVKGQAWWGYAAAITGRHHRGWRTDSGRDCPIAAAANRSLASASP